MDLRLKAAVLLVLTLALPGVAGDKKKALTKEQREYQKRCPLKLDGKWHNVTIRRLQSGEHYLHSPLVSYNIEEGGTVTNVRLVRSSGASKIDKNSVEQTALNRYKPRLPGCGVIETQMDLTIDWY